MEDSYKYKKYNYDTEVVFGFSRIEIGLILFEGLCIFAYYLLRVPKGGVRRNLNDERKFYESLENHTVQGFKP